MFVFVFQDFVGLGREGAQFFPELLAVRAQDFRRRLALELCPQLPDPLSKVSDQLFRDGWEVFFYAFQGGLVRSLQLLNTLALVLEVVNMPL